MQRKQFHAYLRYVADWRLTQLKLSPVFGYFEIAEGGYTQLKPDPLPWLVEILNGLEHANFFEQPPAPIPSAVAALSQHSRLGAQTV